MEEHVRKAHIRRLFDGRKVSVAPATITPPTAPDEIGFGPLEGGDKKPAAGTGAGNPEQKKTTP